MHVDRRLKRERQSGQSVQPGLHTFLHLNLDVYVYVKILLDLCIQEGRVVTSF